MSKELLFSVTKKDLKIETFKSGKSGGQKRDKVATACRITHPESGAIGQSQDQRSLEQNKKKAFRRMLETQEWKKWHRIKSAEMLGIMETVEERVEKAMELKNLKIEINKEGKWTNA